MKRFSRNMENSLMSIMTKAMAHSAGESRKHKLVPSKSSLLSSRVVGEASSHMAEDVVPPRLPTKEGLKVSDGTHKSKPKQKEFDPASIRHPNSTKWFPIDHVGEFFSARLRLPLDKSVRAKLKSECPKPSLPSHTTSTPSIDQPLITFFSKFGKDPRKGVDKAWSSCQDKLLDVVGPLARIFDLAESARLDGSDLNPEDISLWVQRAFCLLGNANTAITHERRKGLLIKLDPKLPNLTTQDPGAKADGLPFGDTLVRDLSKFVTTFASLDKAQQSIKKVFPSLVFGRAGRGRSRSTGRGYQNQGSRGFFNNGQQDFKPQFYPQRGRGFRGRGQRSFHHNSNQQEMSLLISSEIQSLLSKQAILIAPFDSSGFLSSLFLVRKKNKKMRPVINLKWFNQFVVYRHFKMETILHLRGTLRQNDWMVRINLQDAFLTIPIHDSHTKFL
ncbi:uncharacterized protein LOC144752592 [Lissotriton helveticus]